MAACPLVRCLTTTRLNGKRYSAGLFAILDATHYPCKCELTRDEFIHRAGEFTGAGKRIHVAAEIFRDPRAKFGRDLDSAIRIYIYMYFFYFSSMLGQSQALKRSPPYTREIHGADSPIRCKNIPGRGGIALGKYPARMQTLNRKCQLTRRGCW
jgi:hypothetical protein